MRVQKTEQVVLTVDEYNALDKILDKLDDLDIKDDNMLIARNTLQEAITNFFENCAEDLD